MTDSLISEKQFPHAHKKSLLLRLRRNWQIYVFLILPIAYLLIFRYTPMVGVQIAFRDFTATGGIWGSRWVGLENFERFFQSYQFNRVVGNTLLLSLYSLAAGFPIPILLALGMNSIRSKSYCSLVQNITYMPHFISTVVMVGIIFQVFDTRIGIFSVIYKFLSGQQTVPNLLASAPVFPSLYVWSGIWQHTGWDTVIYMAALSGVDPEKHEAAIIDGASRFQRLRYIDYPTIVPTIAITLILRCGSLMNIGFDKIYLMQNSLNLRASEVISTYVYKVGIASGGGNFSYGAAIGLFNSVINLIIIVIVNAVSRKVSENSLW